MNEEIGLNGLQRIEYERCIDAMMLSAQCPEPTEEMKKAARDHASLAVVDKDNHWLALVRIEELMNRLSGPPPNDQYDAQADLDELKALADRTETFEKTQNYLSEEEKA